MRIRANEFIYFVFTSLDPVFVVGSICLIHPDWNFFVSSRTNGIRRKQSIFFYFLCIYSDISNKFIPLFDIVYEPYHPPP